ncbi:efflux RND transporter periplasmic adaptor subunit [Pedobacter boryungensis]|uniref:Efflux RND transporter periplasmic adaptor subunit n=1 Tax=Pedobacter boryungensis TaxID=869962 RepID=A0ABX2DE90_9SPHI|nr:HlyD family efflux transporter periplasmic adaptor subunit [Pedobacter boryungensis]NQX31286.1 efflux RND transporter periplasmic adaptor subunit [Pedobacter boryungensis]
MERYIKILSVFILIAFASCKQSADTETEQEIDPITPVQVTNVADSSLTESIEVTAVSAYLEKSFVKANINGYVLTANAQTGKQVSSKQVLFSLITKEAKAIGNSVNKLDPELKFSGVSTIRAAQSGLIIQANHQKGDYVQDGEAMATISNRNSLVFLLDLPYEYTQLINSNRNLQIELPDGQKIAGVLSGTMPAVDSLAQTQRYIIKVNAGHLIPEGLIAKVKLTKLNRPNAQVLPKSAVLANETEDEFWVMKMINDSTAVKVNVKKGIENNSVIEVVSPKFDKKDRIITSGNYGIADTAKVKILK